MSVGCWEWGGGERARSAVIGDAYSNSALLPTPTPPPLRFKTMSQSGEVKSIVPRPVRGREEKLNSAFAAVDEDSRVGSSSGYGNTSGGGSKADSFDDDDDLFENMDFDSVIMQAQEKKNMEERNGGSPIDSGYSNGGGNSSYSNGGGNYNSNGGGGNYNSNGGGNYNSNGGGDYNSSGGGNYNSSGGGNYNSNVGDNYNNNTHNHPSSSNSGGVDVSNPPQCLCNARMAVRTSRKAPNDGRGKNGLKVKERSQSVKLTSFVHHFAHSRVLFLPPIPR